MRQRIINFPENGSLNERKQFYKLVVGHLEEVGAPALPGFRQYMLPSFSGEPISLEEDTKHPYGLSMGLLRNLQYDAKTQTFHYLKYDNTKQLAGTEEQVHFVPRPKPQLRADRERMMERARYQQKKKQYGFKGAHYPGRHDVPLELVPEMITQLEDLLEEKA